MAFDLIGMGHDRATSVQSAIGEAIFQITGKRYRDLGFAQHDLRWRSSGRATRSHDIWWLLHDPRSRPNNRTTSNNGCVSGMRFVYSRISRTENTRRIMEA